MKPHELKNRDKTSAKKKGDEKIKPKNGEKAIKHQAKKKQKVVNKKKKTLTKRQYRRASTSSRLHMPQLNEELLMQPLTFQRST
jgi:hypothetical protein